jgi:hypothetical protein
MSEQKCPKCGSKASSKAGQDWNCGTYVAHDSEGAYLDESEQCLRNQLALKSRALDELAQGYDDCLVCDLTHAERIQKAEQQAREELGL